MKIMRFSMAVIAFIGSMTMKGMERDDSNALDKKCKDVNDIPKYCTQLAKAVSRQPLFDGKGAVAKSIKILPLKNFDDTKICEMLSKSSEEKLGYGDAWHIRTFGHTFGRWNYPLAADGERIRYGIALWLYPPRGMCSHKVLKDRFRNVINLLQNGWQPSSLQEYPEIYSKKDENVWNLFIKKKPLVEEDSLIRFLASKFKVKNIIDCPDQEDSALDKYQDITYLWIKKDAIDDFDAIFHFNLKKQSVDLTTDN